METTELLESIIKATENKPVPAKRVIDRRQLLALAHITKAEVEEETEPSLHEKFEENTLIALFSQISSAFNQVNTLFTRDFPWHEIEKIERRLFKKVKAVECLSLDTQRKIKQFIYSGIRADVGSAVLLLSSIDSFTDCILSEFAKTEPEYVPSFINGLKWSYSKKMSEKIHLIYGFLRDDLKKACLEILSFRDDYKMPDHTSEENVNDLALYMRLRSPETKEMMFLESQLLLPVLDVNLVYRLLVSGSFITFEEIKKRVTESPESNSDLIPLFAMCCNRSEHSIIKDYFASEFQGVRNGAYVAAGISGATEFLPHLINALELETDEDVANSVIGSLELVTGAKGEKSTHFWDDAIKSIPRGKYLRRGKELTLNRLVDEVEDSFNPYSSRETSLKELLIRIKPDINFHLNWPVLKQLSVISEIRNNIPKQSVFSFYREDK